MSEIIYNDPPRRPKWLLPAVVAGGLLLACAVVLGVGFSVAGGASSDEQKVRAWIVNHADDGRSVEFVSWGPHDLKGEWADLAKRRNDAMGMPSVVQDGAKVLRVRYRAKNRAGAMQLYDVLAQIMPDGARVSTQRNDFGDAWLEHVRKLLSEKP